MSKKLLVRTSLDNSVMRAVIGTLFALQNMSIATKQCGIGMLVYRDVTSAVTKLAVFANFTIDKLIDELGRILQIRG